MNIQPESMMKPLLVALLALLFAASCGGSSSSASEGHGHSHDDGHDHGDHDHSHEEGNYDLGTAHVGAMAVTLTQGHGVVSAGKESHLVVKLPYSDQGQSVVRAWLGVADRLQSYVGKGEYDADSDVYNIHATAPDKLPKDCKWWIEVEKPDSSKHLGSSLPIIE